MTGVRTATVLFAGHSFHVATDASFGATQDRYLRAFVPEHRPAPSCADGGSTVRIHRDADLFRDRMARVAGAPSRTVVPFRSEPYRSCRLGRITWWRPDPDSHLPQDHLYARDAAGALTILPALGPSAASGT